MIIYAKISCSDFILFFTPFINMTPLFRTLIFLLSVGFLANAQADSYTPVEKEQKLLSELQHFMRIFGTIQQGYVDEISTKDLFNKAIKGLMAQLDPHSSYLEPKEQEDLLENSSGKFGGLGIVIGMEDGLVKIISPIDDTPAYRAGLQAGDLIFKINTTSVRGLGLSDAVDMMRGEPGTAVSVTILRQGVDPFEVSIVRDIITIISVKGYLLQDGIGYVRVSSFQAPSAALLKKILLELQEKNEKPLSGLVLDLRNNPGGLLHSAVEISDLFLDDKGLLVYTKGRVSNANQEYRANAGDILDGTPIAVLINKGTASAAEIVSGALQDHKRAIVLGEKSFGKGSVQTVTTLGNDYGLKLTTARYYTPSGRSIQAEGIEPDIILEPLKLEKNTKSVNLGGSEEDLKGHLEKSVNPPEQSQLDDTAASATSKTDKKDKKETELESTEDIQQAQKITRDQDTIKALKEDYFVNQAINALKVMKFWR